ncbi:MAG: hypothetical protein LBL42_06900 [Tannerella sp.]|nr:hypothetical protein [Tannerella sp.]
MKLTGNRLYFLLLAAALLLVFLYQYRTPKEFVWRPTYSKYDKQPFGSYVFDDVLSSSIEGYQVVNLTFYQLLRETEYEEDPTWLLEDAPEDSFSDLEELFPETEYDGPSWTEDAPEDSSPSWEEEEEEEEITDADYLWEDSARQEEEPAVEPLPPEQRRSILVTEHHAGFSNVDVKALRTLLKQGNRVMLCLGFFPDALCNLFCFSETDYTRPRVWAMEQYAREGFRRDSLFLGVDSLHPERVYAVYPHMHPNILQEGLQRYHWETAEDSISCSRLRCDSSRVLVRNREGGAVVQHLFVGEGELFLVATPLMFTNYGLLDGDNASYAFRLLSYLKDYPVIRTEAYGINSARSESPLRYLLSRPPLRWALYLSLVTLLLCMIFTARRRQWVIPVVRPPANETLRFTRLIGNLYYQRKDYKDLLCRKYLYFCNEVKQLSGFDLQSGEPDREINARLAEKTGQDAQQTWPAFRELKYRLREQTPVCEEDMMRHIDQMNEWKRMMN